MMNLVMYFSGLGASKALSPLQVKDEHKTIPGAAEVYSIHSILPIMKKNMQRFCFVIGGFSLRTMYL